MQILAADTGARAENAEAKALEYMSAVLQALLPCADEKAKSTKAAKTPYRREKPNVTTLIPKASAMLWRTTAKRTDLRC